MKITVEFENLEEFQKYVRQERSMTITGDGITFTEGGVSRTSPVLDPSMINKAVEVAAEEVKAEPEMPKKEPEVPKKEPEVPKTEDESPVVDENYRLKVRKTLASLNKMKSGNPAKALIAETGYKRLTEVPLQMLPGLLARAEEVMQNA